MERTAMSMRELERAQVLQQVAAHTLSVREAAARMHVSYRQAKRLWQRFRTGGAAALQHRLVGRVSNRAWTPAARERALGFVAQALGGRAEAGEDQRFGPTLAAEHVAAEVGVAVPVTTLRRWMRDAGLWSLRRTPKVQRKRRTRSAHFGELVQLDGSPHAWFERRGPRCCLFAMVDDATGRTVQHFAPGESTWGALTVLRAWITQYGVPRALYVDGAGIYRRGGRRSRMHGKDLTEGSQFARICAALDIRLIVATSPQAKGRVERAHGTHQDRLVKKMRRVRIGTIAGGNRFLPTYLAQHNAQFTVPAASALDLHRPAPDAATLAALWHLEYERVVGKDGVVRYAGRELQLERTVRFRVPDGSRVVVREAEDGTLTVIHRAPAGDRRCAWHPAPPRPAALRPPLAPPTDAESKRPPYHPPRDHPWRQVIHKWTREALAAKAHPHRGHS